MDMPSVVGALKFKIPFSSLHACIIWLIIFDAKLGSPEYGSQSLSLEILFILSSY